MQGRHAHADLHEPHPPRRKMHYPADAAEKSGPRGNARHDVR